MANSKKQAPQDFESALNALQSLVEELEGGDVPLEAMVAKFAEGHALLAQCNEQLKAAQLRVEQLRAGENVPAPLEGVSEL